MSEQPERREARGARGAREAAWKVNMFRVAGVVAPLVPLGLARRLAVAGSWLAWALAGGLRRRAEWNLGHIPALASDPAARRRAARQAFTSLALNYLDFFRGRRVTSAELTRGWEIEGWDIFERALARGRGVIVMAAHYGPFEYAAWKLGDLGRPLVTPAERLRPEALHHLVAAMRNHHGVRMIAGDERESLRELLAALRRGEMVFFAIDRWVMGPGSPWPLFGTPARLPTAPFALAARSEAPVLLMWPRRLSLSRFSGVVQALTPERLDPALAGATPTPPANREAVVVAMRARVYPAIERLIAGDPGQWVSALSPVWEIAPDDATRNTAKGAPASPARIPSGAAG
jgi:lauroyl/myristoyl acyltransferase